MVRPLPFILYSWPLSQESQLPSPHGVSLLFHGRVFSLGAVYYRAEVCPARGAGRKRREKGSKKGSPEQTDRAHHGGRSRPGHIQWVADSAHGWILHRRYDGMTDSKAGLMRCQ